MNLQMSTTYYQWVLPISKVSIKMQISDEWGGSWMPDPDTPITDSLWICKATWLICKFYSETTYFVIPEIHVYWKPQQFSQINEYANQLSIPFQLYCEYANNTPKTSQLCKLAQWQLIPDHSWICKLHKSIMWGKPRFQEAHEYVNESRAYTNPTRSCYTHFLSCDLRMEGNLPPSSWWRTHVYIHVYIRKSLLVSQTRS